MIPEMLDVAGLVLGVVLTLLIFSYLLGDNPLYRLALHLFVGALVGYSFGLILREVLLKITLGQLQSYPILLVPLVMGLWLFFFKSIPRLAYMGNFVLAFLIGVGTAVALSGALMGIIIPQIEATGRALSFPSPVPFRLGLLDGLLIVVGTVCTLMAFNFAARKQRGLAGAWARLVGVMTGIGRVFLLFAFGVAFAGALTASLSIFIGRMQYIIDVLVDLYFRLVGG